MVTDTISEAGTAAVDEVRSAFADMSTVPFYALAAAAIAASVGLSGRKEGAGDFRRSLAADLLGSEHFE